VGKLEEGMIHVLGRKDWDSGDFITLPSIRYNLRHELLSSGIFYLIFPYILQLTKGNSDQRK
jgi:hypothetical protein